MKAVQREARAERQPYEEALTCPFDVFAKQVEPPAERPYPGFDLSLDPWMGSWSVGGSGS
jgi:hypothetical protein